MATVLTISAGRSFRRSQSAKWVDPQPEKGTIEVRPDQGILTFLWRNKETQNAEDELLIFPGEANFERVPADKSGRTFVLKFNSSNQTHFFWLQRGALDATTARACVDLDAILQDPDYALGTNPVPDAFFSSAEAAAPAAPAASAESASPSASAPAAKAGPSSTAAGGSNEDIARLLYNWADQHLPIPEADDEDASLTDILTTDTVSRLLVERPDLADTLAPFMPPELGEASTPEALLRVVATPQFRDAVGSLEAALRSGALPDSMIPWVSPPREGVWNLRAFLNALRDVQKDENIMDTD